MISLIYFFKEGGRARKFIFWNVSCSTLLVEPFQSDALLVPEHCIFDHIHDSKVCTSFGEWNRSAVQSCVNRAMDLQSFGVLQPCGVGRFNGVEYVCCPKERGEVMDRIRFSFPEILNHSLFVIDGNSCTVEVIDLWRVYNMAYSLEMCSVYG